MIFTPSSRFTHKLVSNRTRFEAFAVRNLGAKGKAARFCLIETAQSGKIWHWRTRQLPVSWRAQNRHI